MSPLNLPRLARILALLRIMQGIYHRRNRLLGLGGFLFAGLGLVIQLLMPAPGTPSADALRIALAIVTTLVHLAGLLIALTGVVLLRRRKYLLLAYLAAGVNLFLLFYLFLGRH